MTTVALTLAVAYLAVLVAGVWAWHRQITLERRQHELDRVMTRTPAGVSHGVDPLDPDLCEHGYPFDDRKLYFVQDAMGERWLTRQQHERWLAERSSP